MTAPFRTAPACDTNDAKGHAAGIVFVAPDGDILLLRRSSKEANYSGHWALPGGGVDAGETPELAADREVGEEMGVRVKTPKKLLDRRRTPTDMVFHTFAQPVPEKFVPRLNEEHSGYAWAPLDMLPQPVHPAVKATIAERIGAAADMAPEDWDGMREGFLKWTLEEEAEPEHAEDRMAADSALRLALDRASIRKKSDEGHLHVGLTPISKATVNPYRGSEIPDAENLGLDPDAIYYLLRDPEELAKAAASFNGKPLLAKHIPVSAEDHATSEVIGSTGTEAVFHDPYLMNAIVVWPGSAVDDIESETKKELSCGYRYRADMTPGIFRGMRFDGVMRDIVGNHVALVKDGRAGPDVVVGDSMENLKMKTTTRIAAVALRSTALLMIPLMAMDATPINLMPLFKDVTTKNFKDKKPGILAALKKDAKLAKDANLESVVELLDVLEGNRDAAQDEPVPQEQLASLEKESVAAPAPAFVAEDATGKMKGFLKDCGLDDAKIEQAMSMMPKPDIGAGATDEEDDEAKKKAAEEEAKKKAAADAEVDPDKKDKEPMDKKAMDAAISTAVTSAVETERKTQQGIRMALDEVRPYVGEFAASMAFDSATSVYRKAAEVMGISGAADINEAGLRTIIKMQPKAGAHPVRRADPVIGMDESSVSSFNKMFPGADRIQSV